MLDRRVLINVLVVIFGMPLAAAAPQLGAASLIQDLNATLLPILKEKSKEWLNSGLVVALRQGNETLDMAAGYNDMVPATQLSLQTLGPI